MSNNRNDIKSIRRKEAEERMAEREKRSPKEQLDFLDRKLGKGKGAKRERTRLLQQIETKKTS